MNREEKLREIGYLFGLVEERLLYYACMHLETGNRHYAEDAVQHAFERVIHKVDELDFEHQENIQNYLYKIIKHWCYNMNRYNRKFGCTDNDEEECEGIMEKMMLQEAEAEHIVCANELIVMIRGLRKNYAQALLLSGVYGLSTAQIAKRMGISEMTARQYLARGRKQMKKKYKLDDWS